MKTDYEMYQSLLSRYNEYQEKQKKSFRIIKKVRKEGKAFRKKLRTFVVSKAESVKNDSFRYSTAAASLIGVVGVGIGAIAMWQALKEPVPDNIDPRPPIIVHTTATSQTTTKPTETTVTTVTIVSTTQASTKTAEKVTATAAPYEEEVYTEPAVTTKKREEIKLTQEYINYVNTHLTCDRINEYTDQYDIDAECYINYHSESKEDKPLLLLYINDKGREEIEWYIKENNIDISKILIEEMDLDYKTYSINARIRRFIEINELSCDWSGGGIRQYDDTHIDIDPEIFESESEKDLKTLEEYITYHGYDKIIPYSFKVRDPADDTAEETEVNEQTAQEEEENK